MSARSYKGATVSCFPPLEETFADTIASGPDVSGDKDILHFSQLNFIGGKYDWAYKSVPQKAYDGREIDIPSGRALGGGSVINGCKCTNQRSPKLTDDAFCTECWTRRMVARLESRL